VEAYLAAFAESSDLTPVAFDNALAKKLPGAVVLG
jgi:hypothetical protein